MGVDIVGARLYLVVIALSQAQAPVGGSYWRRGWWFSPSPFLLVAILNDDRVIGPFSNRHHARRIDKRLSNIELFAQLGRR